MDQQFESYEKFFRKSWSKIKALILPGVVGETRTGLIVLGISILALTVLPIIEYAPIMWRLFSNDREMFWSLIGSYAFVLVLPISTLIMLSGKKLGWIIIGIWFFKRTLAGLFELFFFKLFMDEYYTSGTFLDGFYGLSLKETVVGIIVFGCVVIYLHLKKTRAAFGVTGKLRFLPFVIGVIWVAVGFALI